MRQSRRRNACPRKLIASSTSCTPTRNQTTVSFYERHKLWIRSDQPNATERKRSANLIIRTAEEAFRTRRFGSPYHYGITATGTRRRTSSSARGLPGIDVGGHKTTRLLSFDRRSKTSVRRESRTRFLVWRK